MNEHRTKTAMARFYVTAESISKKFNIIVLHVDTVPELFRITSHAITMNNSSSPKEGFRFLSRCHIEDGLHSVGFFCPIESDRPILAVE